MPDNLTSGTFRIVSLTEGEYPVGVDFTRPASQTVRLNEPVGNWDIKKIGDRLRLSIGGYRFTGIVDDKVTASVHAGLEKKWRATYREAQDAYTIELVDDPSRGWTVCFENPERPEIEIKLIIAAPSEPPRFLHSQLYRFERVDE